MYIMYDNVLMRMIEPIKEGYSNDQYECAPGGCPARGRTELDLLPVRREPVERGELAFERVAERVRTGTWMPGQPINPTYSAISTNK